MPLTYGPTPDSLLQHLGRRLRRLRQARNLRQLDMAALGLNYKYYQRLELGQVNPTLLTLYKVAAALEVSVYELFRPEAEQTPDTALPPVGETNIRKTPLTHRL